MRALASELDTGGRCSVKTLHDARLRMNQAPPAVLTCRPNVPPMFQARAPQTVNDWIQLVTAENPVEAGFLRGLLEAAGIPVQLRSMELWTAAVEIYYSDGARPSVWVRESDLERAREVLAERRGEGPSWGCPGCGERLEAQFTSCWRCGQPRGEAE